MRWSKAEGLADFDRPCKRQYYAWRKGMDSHAMYQVLLDLGLEVQRAKEMWGEEFDQKNTLNDWITYNNIYASKAAEMDRTVEEQEKYLRKAAGLLINALVMLKSTGFAPRHYENQTRPKSLPEIA
jgi:hypothetical protein